MQHGSRPPAYVAFYIFYLTKYDECVYITLISNREIIVISQFNNYRRTLTIMEETHERII